jgi:hypothetical protein
MRAVEVEVWRVAVAAICVLCEHAMCRAGDDLRRKPLPASPCQGRS